MDALPFETLFAIAAGALVLSVTVASSMSRRPGARVQSRRQR